MLPRGNYTPARLNNCISVEQRKHTIEVLVKKAKEAGPGNCHCLIVFNDNSGPGDVLMIFSVCDGNGEPTGQVVAMSLQVKESNQTDPVFGPNVVECEAAKVPRVSEDVARWCSQTFGLVTGPRPTYSMPRLTAGQQREGTDPFDTPRPEVPVQGDVLIVQGDNKATWCTPKITRDLYAGRPVYVPETGIPVILLSQEQQWELHRGTINFLKTVLPEQRRDDGITLEELL